MAFYLHLKPNDLEAAPSSRSLCSRRITKEYDLQLLVIFMVCSLRSNWREEKEAEEDYQKQVVRRRKGTDEEARWVYKQKRYHYGYKKHCPTNVQGIVQKVITTAANRSDTKEFIPLLQGANIPQGTAVLADKGYACGENRSYLQTHHLQDGIMHKAQRNRALTEEEKQRNKAIGPIRSTIERTFGSIRRWFHGGRCRYRGLAKTHTQNILESIAFNLYRTPGIIMSSSLG